MNNLLHMAAIFMILLLTLGGCKDDKGTAAESATLLSEQAIKELESQVHLDLPRELSLLKSSDGGGRDSQLEYHIWVVYSMTGIEI